MIDVSSGDWGSLTFLKELMGYLKTEKEVGKVIASQSIQKSIPLRIKISNTAPNDPQKPFIVFAGVKVIITNPNNPNCMWAHAGGSRKHYELEYQNVECAWLIKVTKIAGNFPEFPMDTQDEKRQGHLLFAGESLTYKFIVPQIELQNCLFHVEGNVSRRHLFHFNKEI